MNTRARRAVFATAAIVGAAALAGCAGSAAGSAPAASGSLTELTDDQQVEIVFESYNLANVGTFSDAINQLLDEFMDENPSIKDEIQREILKVLGVETTPPQAPETPEVSEVPSGEACGAVNSEAAKKPQKAAAPGNGQRA